MIIKLTSIALPPGVPMPHRLGSGNHLRAHDGLALEYCTQTGLVWIVPRGKTTHIIQGAGVLMEVAPEPAKRQQKEKAAS